MRSWRLDPYTTPAGNIPFRKDLDGLTPGGVEALERATEALLAEGMELGEPLVKQLVGHAPLRELRFSDDRGQPWRLLFFCPGGRRLIAVHFCHRRDLTTALIRVAKDRVRDWKRRNP